MIGIKTRCFFR